jgi:hypothetical protein
MGTRCSGWVLLAGLALAAQLSRAAPPDVPPELEPWRGWALDGQEYRRCPFLANGQAVDRDSFVCAWPERLSLDVSASGARFTQRWTVHEESWIPLPGSNEYWPREVTVDGDSAAVVAAEDNDDMPALRLGPGTYTVTGTFRWARRPEALPIPQEIGLVDLTVDGQGVAMPERPEGSIWLGKRRTAQQQEQMEVQVYRRVDDSVPVRLITQIRLQVAGDGREELLSRPLPEGFVPLSLDSELPARIEPDGRLRVQVRAGSWEVTIAARGPGVAQSLKRPKVDGPWAREEVWSFAADDRLRLVAVEGASGVDPVQTGVPATWRNLPAYRMTEDTELRVVERSRGLSSADENQLQLNRTLWLDFDHEGYTIVDSIRGRMRKDWRLDVAEPQRLMNASSKGEQLLVTRISEGLTGIEVREPAVDLTALSRSDEGGRLSATGWRGRFMQVGGTLNLPPGHRLLAVGGADSAPSSWIERWRLLDMFLVLIASAAVARLLGWPAGVLALIALGLTHHDNEGLMVWLWLNLLVAYVLAREAPEGRLRKVAGGYRLASVLVLLLALVPFVFQEARLALYPQLETTYFGGSRLGMERVVMPQAVDQPVFAPPMATPPPPAEVSAMPTEPAAAPAEELMQEGVDEDTGAIAVTGSRADLSAIEATSRAFRKSGGGLNVAQVVQRYAPGTLVQTGPGRPGWSYGQHWFSWSGPVDDSQSLRFVVLTPFWLGLWRIVGCLLLAALFVLIAGAAFGRPRLPGWAQRWSTAAPLVLLSLLPLADAHAQTPSAALLQELKTRLTRAPQCAPTCGDIMQARVRASGSQLEVTLEVSALERVAVPIPQAQNRWEPDSISVDGQANGGVYRDGDGTRWIALRPGAHEVRLVGRIAPGDSVPLSFPMRPRTIDVSAEGWDVSGVGDGRLLTDTLELVRRRGGTDAARMDAGREFPPFVRVHRHLVLDLDWSATTSVTRLAPEKGAFTMPVQLMPTESVLTEGIEVSEGRKAMVAMPAGEFRISWSSGLPRAERIELGLEAGAPRAEVWSFAVSPTWHVTFNGVPAVVPENPDGQQWIFEFHPRGGEKLQVAVTRPQPVEGATLALDGVSNVVNVGKRVTTGTLQLQYRSTLGGRHSIALPEAARVTSVVSDGRPVALRPDRGELTLALLPGAHTIRVDWELDGDVGLRSAAPQIDLRTPASNVTTVVNMPEDRWVLVAFGPGVGPAILFWSELAVFLALAILIGGWRHSPLGTREWLLLGLGLSTFSWAVLLVFAGWLFIMRWRESFDASALRRTRFNLTQVALALLSVIALVSLVAAIPNGLLGTPDMRIAGAHGGLGEFAWFVDITASALPQPGVISVSMWWYRAAMLAWALWLSFALLRWLPWAWRAWQRDGLWRAPEPRDTAPRAPAPKAG